MSVHPFQAGDAVTWGPEPRDPDARRPSPEHPRAWHGEGPFVVERAYTEPRHEAEEHNERHGCWGNVRGWAPEDAHQVIVRGIRATFSARWFAKAPLL